MAIMQAENEPLQSNMDLTVMESDHEDDENEYEGNNEVYNEANEFEFYWKRDFHSPRQAAKNVLVRHIHSLF